MSRESWASTPAAAATMRANRSRDTKPELAVRSVLHGWGHRYRVDHRPLPDLNRRADIVFTRARVAVFIDGCFWHGCPLHHQAPASNAEFWLAKVRGNRARDEETTRILTAAGWLVLRYWEHLSPLSVASDIAMRVLLRDSSIETATTRPEVCVVYAVRDTCGRREVLLGRKKTGLGRGKLVGLGGKLNPAESPLDAAVREAEEEATIILDRGAMRRAGFIDYEFPTQPEWSQRSHVFVCTEWTGQPGETDELQPEWFPLERISFDQMWDDARYWLTGVLNGGDIRAHYEFNTDLESVVFRKP